MCAGVLGSRIPRRLSCKHSSFKNPAVDKKASCRQRTTMTTRLLLRSSPLYMFALSALLVVETVALAGTVTAQEIIDGISCQTAIQADATTGSAPEIERRLPHEAEVVALAWSPDGSALAAGTIFNTVIALWDERSGKKLRELRRGSGWDIYHDTLAFTSDGKYLLTPVADGSPGSDRVALTLWDVASASIAQQIQGPFPDEVPRANVARHIAISPNGEFLALLTDLSAGRSFALYETARWQIVGRPSVAAGRLEAVAFSPNGQWLAVGTIEGDIAIFDVLSQAQLRTIRAYTTGSVAELVFSADGAFIASGTEAHEIKPDPDHSKAWVPADPIRIWRVADGSLVRSYVGNSTHLIPATLVPFVTCPGVPQVAIIWRLLVMTAYSASGMSRTQVKARRTSFICHKTSLLSLFLPTARVLR
jgi:hypothetical protein